jgi:hypothetical protein
VSFYKDSRQHTNPAAEQAEAVFAGDKKKRAKPRKGPDPDNFPTRQYMLDQEKFWENRIAALRVLREAAANNPPAQTKQQRRPG